MVLFSHSFGDGFVVSTLVPDVNHPQIAVKELVMASVLFWAKILFLSLARRKNVMTILNQKCPFDIDYPMSSIHLWQECHRLFWFRVIVLWLVTKGTLLSAVYSMYGNWDQNTADRLNGDQPLPRLVWSCGPKFGLFMWATKCSAFDAAIQFGLCEHETVDAEFEEV